MDKTVSKSQLTTTPNFWRDANVPFIEARFVEDGRQVCYAKHSHTVFSVGAITSGRSTYLNESKREQVSAGAVVLMNPEQVHACNPIENLPWSYLMLYVDTAWLGRLQQDLGLSRNQDFLGFLQHLSLEPALYAAIRALYAVLLDPLATPLHKESSTISFFIDLQQRIAPLSKPLLEVNSKLGRAADFMHEQCMALPSLEQVCQQAELSPSYLIRAFKQEYGMTPHAYLLNSRVQYAQAQLRKGVAIADVALQAGFADQAHFQRTFKRLLAATPGQYQAAYHK